MESSPSYFKSKKRPVEKVSWYDAVLFCNQLSMREGKRPVYRLPDGAPVKTRQEVEDAIVFDRKADGYRLPTEAEWEHAARAGRGTEYAGSDDVDAVAWYRGNAGGKTHSVGQKRPNAWGLYDMSGNVWEWCWDWYGDYPANVSVDPIGPNNGSFRVFRGGSWDNYPAFARVAFRLGRTPSNSGGNLGLRLARSV